MYNKSRIALSLAIVLGTASAAMAASKHPVHHAVQAAVESQETGTNAYGQASGLEAYGFTESDPSAAQVVEPTYMAIQTKGAEN